MDRTVEFTRGEIEEFVQGRMWKHIVATLTARVNTLMEENNNLDPFTQPTAICRNQGVIVGMGEVVDLPAIMAEQVEYESRMKKKEEDVDNE